MHFRKCLPLYFLLLLIFFFPIHQPSVNADTIYGTPGNDSITVPPGTPYSGVISYAGDDTIILESGAVVAGEDQIAAEVLAGADSTAIDTGSGNDVVTNQGSISATADATALHLLGDPYEAKARAYGIWSPGGANIFQNFSEISVQSLASEAELLPEDQLVENYLTDSLVESYAYGILAGPDSFEVPDSAPDHITNNGLISVISTATAGADYDKAVPRAKAFSFGIEGSYNANDVITNAGTITVNATSTFDSLQYSIEDIEGGAEVEAEAYGISGHLGRNQIENTGTINADAEATAEVETVNIQIWTFGTHARPTTANATAKGIDGGAGRDMMMNSDSGTIAVNAKADAYTGSGTVAALQYEVTAAGDARTEAKATAVGMAAGAGDDNAVNTGTIYLTADSDASTADVSVEILGDVKANAATTSSASAVGIEGGAGNDGISNAGSINMNTITAVSVSQAVDVKMVTIPTAIGEFFGADLGDAKTEAETDATGIAGGTGNDTIDNSGTIDIFTFADADSNSVTATLTITSTGGGSPKAAGPNVGLLASPVAEVAGGGAAVAVAAAEDGAEGGDIVDTGTTARTVATGMDGGAGMDRVTNTGKIAVKGESDADSVSVNATVNIAKGGLLNIFPGMALAEAETKAQTTAAGIDGGAGGDTILNEDEVIVEAISNSTSATVGVLLKGVTSKGLAYGGAISKAETEAIATAAGITGAEDDDTIENSGMISVKATPDAKSASISATLMGAKEGLVAGFTYADAATKAEANATGIDGGKGKDTINNTGQIEVTADKEMVEDEPMDKESTSASVALTVEGSFSQEWSAILGGSIADGNTSADFRAVGIDGGGDNDTIENAGRIIAQANPDADSFGIILTLTGAQDGLTAGFSYADAETTAKATAVGISGGTGDDTITNARTGQIEVKANPTSTSASIGVTVSGVIEGTGIVGGAAMADGTTKAVTDLYGISGGDGDDTITNEGSISLTNEGKIIIVPIAGGIPIEVPAARSESITVNIGAAMGELGLVGGFSYADNETTARTTAVGIDGGIGNDIITNTGEIEVTIKPTATSASISVTAQGVFGTGAAVGVSLTDGTTRAISDAAGIKAGDGKDSIHNSGTITVDSQSTAGSASVSVSIVGGKEGAAVGVSYADATTTAAATASGIADRNGQAAVTHSGTILASSTAVTDSDSVSVTASGEKTGLAAGVSLADLTTKSTAASYGLDTGEIGTGNDSVYNLGTVDAEATATTTATSVAVTLSAAMTGATAGVSAAKSDVTATATTLGVRTGKGDDSIFNDGIENADGYSLDSYAHATSSSDTVAVTVSGAWEGVALGASLAKADTQAAATAVGIDAGEGSDTVTSQSGIRAKAESHVDSDIVSVDVAFSYKGVSAGVALSDTRTNSDAAATGISGGDGNDEVTNRSSLYAEATATTKTRTITINIATIGAAIAQASSTAASETVGLDGGLGVDSLTNEGDISVQATSTADDRQTTVNFIGKASGNVDSTATATATGIRGDDADDQTATGDTITNLAGGSVTVTSHAILDATNYVIQGGGAAFAEAEGTSEAQAFGVAAGAGADTVLNEGSVDVTAWSEADVSSMTLQLSGVTLGKAGADITSRATGIDAGDGFNQITNESTGSINVTSKANATATSMTVNIGVSLQRAAITAKTHATGIKSGDSKDIIDNEGDIDVTATSNVGAAAGDFSLVGLSTADSVTVASVEGIHAGGGDDEVFNTGSITAGNIPGEGVPMAYVEVANVSFSFTKIGLGFLSSKALATGILGGEGDDTIHNEGTILIGNEDWMSEGRAVGFQGNFLEFFSLTGVGAAAETISTGISGGQGNDNVTNDSSGVLDVKATAYAFSDGAADVTTFGSPTVFANATTKATATGISGEQGDDVIVNLGAVTAEAKARADATTDAWVGWGNPTADSSSHAVATAWGIDAGGGRDIIRNKGEISADSVAGTHSFAKADSNVAETKSTAASWAEAFSYGVAGGDDDNKVYNTETGTITAAAQARTYDPQTGIVTRAESDENATAKTSKPVTAYAAGILLGDGDDTVVNDGSITAESSSDAGATAFSNSWPNDARSEADVVGSATALGVAAGDGDNWIENNGQIVVHAWGNAEPIADSFSRDQTSTTNAMADARASAIGIEGSGNILNAATGSIEVKARATAHAETGSVDPESEETTATADLTARATGIGTISTTIRAEPDRLWNDGSITVAALTGEDDEGNPELIARAVVDTETTANKAEAGGASDVDAAGIRVGNHDAEITNTGDIDVLGRARVHLEASSDEDSDAVSGVDEDTAVTVNASGIQTGDGNNEVLNQGSIHATATVDTVSTARASSTTHYATATVLAGGAAGATGIAVGDGDNTVINYGELDVKAENATAEDRPNAVATYPTTHLNLAVADAGGEEASLAADATGIRVGDGSNTIENLGDLTVYSNLEARASAWANTNSGTNQGIAKAGGTATATGVLAGEGRNTINNFGSMIVEAEAYGHSHAYGEDYATSRAHATAEATGILTGDGANVISNTGELTVTAIATAKAVTQEADHKSRQEESTARAIGVQTGNGDDWVKNKGTIAVTAEAKGLIAAATAAGISTGDGNDTIDNHGAIKALITEKGVSSPGIGIDAGLGDDAVTLYAYSAVEGGIDLGDGDDWLTLFGTPLVAGDVTGAAGIDTLMLDGPGSIDFIPMAFENAVKQGPGTYSVPSLPTMERMEVNEGTLEINSSYSMANDSTFQAQVKSDGSHGQLKVNGTAQLNGELNVIRGPGIFINGTRYDVLRANGVEGEFNSETLPENTPLLSFQAVTYSDRVEVETLAKSCTTVATNPLQKKIAQHLDRIMPKATGDMSLVLGDFQALSEPDFDAAFASLSPDSYNNSTRTTLSSTQQYVKTIQQRMHSLRASLKFAAADTRPKYGVWLQGFGQRGDQDSEEGFTGYDSDLYGGSFGADLFFSENVLFGISLGASSADIDFKNSMGDSNIDAYIGSLYGSWFTRRYYLDASLSYGYQEYDNSRKITIGAIHRTATSDHDGSIFSSYLEGGYNFSFNRWMLGPFGTLNYLYLDEDGFTESGAGSLNLKVDNRQTKAMFSQLGAVVAGKLTFENFELMPELRLAWKHDFDIDDQVITSVFAGAPGVEFSIKGQDVEQNSLMVEVGATLFYKNGLMFPIKYAAEFRDGYNAQGILGLIRYEF